DADKKQNKGVVEQSLHEGKLPFVVVIVVSHGMASSCRRKVEFLRQAKIPKAFAPLARGAHCVTHGPSAKNKGLGTDCWDQYSRAVPPWEQARRPLPPLRYLLLPRWQGLLLNRCPAGCCT